MRSEVGLGVSGMSTETGTTRGSRALLAADACLFSAVLAWAPIVVVLGPALAWWLHGRRLEKNSVTGMIVGTVLAAMIVIGIIMLMAYVAPLIVPASVNEFAVPITILSIVGAAFAAAVVGIDVIALRDLAPSRRSELRLDMARLAATGAVLVMAGAIFFVTRSNPSSQIGDAGVFSMAAAVYGAITAGVADMWVMRAEARAGAARPVESA